MKKKLRKWLRMGLLVVFIISTGLLLRQQFSNTGAQTAYDDALQIALGGTGETDPQPAPTTAEAQIQTQQPQWIPEPVTDDPQMEEMAKINLAALRQVNPDVVGWIRIPDTRVDYPLMQGQDNELYLKNTWQKKKNGAGSIFLEYRNNADLTDYNTIVYGHNMNDGSMFACLTKYTDGYYWKSHPYVYILSDAGVYRYEIFSSYKAKTDSPAYGLSFNQSQTKATFLTEILKQARYDTGIIPDPNDRILTLSTCSGMDFSTRWVVHARLKMLMVQP